MARNVKEMIDADARPRRRRITLADVQNLEFEGEGELRDALNEAYIRLLESSTTATRGATIAT